MDSRGIHSIPEVVNTPSLKLEFKSSANRKFSEPTARYQTDSDAT